MRVLFVASECSPYRRTGGLGEVVGALPRFLRRQGIDARVVMPLYAGFDWRRLDVLDGILEVPGSVPRGRVHRRAAVRMSPPEDEVPVYFLEHRALFDRPHIYGPPGGTYGDNLERFSFLSRGAIELAKAVAFHPHILHCHDWQSALVPAHLASWERRGPLAGAATILTIHNLAHQGAFPTESWDLLDLPAEGYSQFEHFGHLNLLKGGLLGADRVTTVSPTYAREITTPRDGMGLDGVLRGRGQSLLGILNGIDPEEWNPEGDPHLAASFSARDLSGKARCKAALQAEAELPQRAEVPLFGLVGRLVAQKGIDLLATALERALDLDLQCVMIGNGDPRLERLLLALAARHPDRCRVWIDFDVARSHRIEAGADFFLMPSRFEPCGLNQMYSLRYGTLPIVHATGGLADTVENYDRERDSGVGFVVSELHAQSLYNTIAWAAATWYQDRGAIERMRLRAMQLDFSWPRAAEEYARLYSQVAG